MDNKICIIGVYFGQLPNYFELWLKSARANAEVDYLIVTDQQLPMCAGNVKLLSMQLHEMKNLAINKLGIHNISLERPYKCCDFKPAYGIIFQDYLHGYDYWGHCDFDMIFGDLSGFFEKYELYSYDKFLALGHLTMYRNTPEVAERYKAPGSKTDYKTVFTSDQSCYFDELNCITRVYTVNGYSQFTKRIFCDIASIYKRYRDIEEYPLDEKAVNHKQQIYYWKDGHVYRKWYDSRNGEHTDEYIYIHFKKRPNFSIGFNHEGCQAFIISNAGFFPLEGEPDLESVKKYNRYYPIRETCETVRNHVTRVKSKAARMIKRRSD